MKAANFCQPQLARLQYAFAAQESSVSSMAAIPRI
jgi:hypothetical protein